MPKDKKKTGEFRDVKEILEIAASANMGIWRIELIDGEEPKMFVDDTMKRLLGIEGKERTPEKTYTDWFSRIKPEAVMSVLQSVERMKQGQHDENTYQWIHPTKGVRYVRCGGTSQKVEGGYSLRGYHYDADDVVRKEQELLIAWQAALNDKNEYYATLETLGSVFYSLHAINLADDTVFEFKARDRVKEIVNHPDGAISMMKQVMCESITDEYIDKALAFTDMTTLADRMQDKQIISTQLVGKDAGWFLATFITMESDESGKPLKVIFATRIIEEEKQNEENLIRKAQTDELTGLLNRRAYEEDLDAYDEQKIDFAYISLDVNGLKVINDSIGHVAGDELIFGSGQCMKNIFGPYGKLYRIGGDEFVALLLCNDDKIKELVKDFDYEIANWSCKLIDGLSVSYGFTSKEEYPEYTARQLAIVADKRMYDAKASYYKNKGVDRRGQQEAHKVLCDSYTKILKINLDNDSYRIVNMDNSEKSIEMGFSNSISKWLRAFGENGYVHEDDLEEYLKRTDTAYIKEYFESNHTSLHIFYRRKFGDVFKQVMMEIIPVSDYGANNQNLFLYVKNLEK
ncbi:MAG: GGDEF domain-containing protein [Lachnospiraceae bacterium]|nr:GGDEF domain-containing protein [Lachnospiraceae bacterium]